MYLRCRASRRPLATEHLLGARRAKSPNALRPPASQSQQQSHRNPPACQWIAQSSHAAAATGLTTHLPNDSSVASPQIKIAAVEASFDTEPRVVRALEPYMPPSQAHHDPQAHSREDWGGERKADQIATLLYTSPDTPSKKEDPKNMLYGKNQADKILVSQVLKDRGQTSYDWRIPLLQLEKCYKRADYKATSENQGLISKIEIHTAFRKVFLEPLRTPVLARDIPEPTSWSELSLFNYLADVIGSQTAQARIPRVVKPQHRNWSNVTDIADIIHHLFRSSQTKGFLTMDAYNTALRFFYKYGIFTRARAIYIQMEATRMHISTETFNIILRGAAGHRDLHNFTFLLHKMIQRGFQPDEVTWVSLLMAINSTAVRAVIVHKMKEKGIMKKPGIAPDVAALMVQHDLTFHLGNGHSFDKFLDHMDSRYGARWLSTSAGNSLLNESSKRISPVENLNLLNDLKLRGFIPNELSMDTLLRKYLPFGKYADAIEIMHAFYEQFNLRPGRFVFKTLLVHAWKSRMLNFSRVVWRSACISGFVTFPMRKLVSQSMLAAVRSEHKSTSIARHLKRSEAFNELAGKFVIGVCNPQRAELPELDRATLIVNSEPEQRKLKQAKVHVQIRNDLLTSRNFRTKLCMVELLRQASYLDRKWAVEGIWKNGGRHPDLQHGVHVEVEGVTLRKARFSS